MGKVFKKFVSIVLSIMLCATAVPTSFVAANAEGSNTVTPKVATSENHTVVLKSDGTVWATGSNGAGQLGVDSADIRKSTFTQCVDADGPIQDAKDVASGGYHTAIIRKDNNEVWSCGGNSYGQLGDNIKEEESTVFVKSSKYTNGSSGDTEEITGTIQIACGYNYTAVLLENGEVWQCGLNYGGQLGNGGTTRSTAFIKSSKYTNGSSGDTEEITGVIQIACADEYTAVLLSNGEVWQCGYNQYGQLGNGSTSDSRFFVKSSKYTNGSSGDTEVITGATDIACGYGHTAIILKNGEVWQCGEDNSYGQLGNGSTAGSRFFVKSYKSKDGNYIAEASVVTSGDDANAEPIIGAIEIACGATHTAVIVNKEVWSCGWNNFGQLGNGSIDQSNIFVKSSNITNAKGLSACSNTTMVLCTEEDGTYTLYGVGDNEYGQLGLGYTGNNDTDNPLNYVTTFTKSTTIGDIGSDLSSSVPDKKIDTITALNGSKDGSVTGAGCFIKGYKLEVEWGNLNYKYEAKWDTEKSDWGKGIWKLKDEDDEDAGKIIVRNFSSVSCKSVFSFEPNNTFKAPSDGEPGTKGVFEDLKITNEPELTTVNEPVESTDSTDQTEGTDETQRTTPVTSAILAVYTESNTVGHQKTVKLNLEGIPESKKGENISSDTDIGKTIVIFKKVS